MSLSCALLVRTLFSGIALMTAALATGTMTAVAQSGTPNVFVCDFGHIRSRVGVPLLTELTPNVNLIYIRTVEEWPRLSAGRSAESMFWNCPYDHFTNLPDSTSATSFLPWPNEDPFKPLFDFEGFDFQAWTSFAGDTGIVCVNPRRKELAERLSQAPLTQVIEEIFGSDRIRVGLSNLYSGYNWNSLLLDQKDDVTGDTATVDQISSWFMSIAGTDTDCLSVEDGSPYDIVFSSSYRLLHELIWEDRLIPSDRPLPFVLPKITWVQPNLIVLGTKHEDFLNNNVKQLFQAIKSQAALTHPHPVALSLYRGLFLRSVNVALHHISIWPRAFPAATLSNDAKYSELLDAWTSKRWQRRLDEYEHSHEYKAWNGLFCYECQRRYIPRCSMCFADEPT